MSSFSLLATNRRLCFCFFQAIFILGFIFANSIYGSLTTLGDGYDPITFNFQTSNFDRTQIVLLVYKLLSFIFPHQVSGLFLCMTNGILAWAICCNVQSIVLRKAYILSFSSIFFLAWSSIPSKEQIVITVTFLIILSLQKIFLGERKFLLFKMFLYFSAITFITYIRYPLVIYLIPVVIIMVERYFDSATISPLTGLTILILIVPLLYIVNEACLGLPIDIIISKWIDGVRSGFFGYDAGSNRDFLASLYSLLAYIPYGMLGVIIPVGIMDSTESLIYFPVFLAFLPPLINVLITIGLVSLTRERNKFVVMVSAWLPATICASIVFAPYVSFNGGASLRYAQAIYPALTMFPVILLDLARQHGR